MNGCVTLLHAKMNNIEACGKTMPHTGGGSATYEGRKNTPEPYMKDTWEKCTRRNHRNRFHSGGEEKHI